MSIRPPGRRTESLFDNRYRYDYIYPRGRSGETLRAYDIQDNDRPVVIKRPAPQDAPPMRAGQEISIRNEKQALERLSGHPVLTELRGSGTFRVGGQTHEYIVMEFAHGQIVEDLVLEYAQRGQYLPELEVLVIMDNLLDLLVRAHDKQVIYNDVDAKHLFWDRETYRLKVIDWGNAVFTDEPGALPTATRASDIYQCGELLYFILTGGNRLATSAEGEEAFFVNFGQDAERIPSRLQAILTRAVHPDPRRRYGTMAELRMTLAEYRMPLEKTRDEIVARVRKRVRATASQEELQELADTLQEALDMDPGYPPAAALAAEIRFHQRQIAIQADLDAIRIYLESGNWPRALSLLHDLLPNAEPINEPLIRFLIAAAALLEDLHLSPPPAGFLAALPPLFQGNAPLAGQTLLTTAESRPAVHQAQWLLAEQLASLMPDVILLRPHLACLRYHAENKPGTESVLALLDEIDTRLAESPLPGLTGLQVVYQQVAVILERLEPELEALTVVPESCLASVIRANRAAHTLLTRLDEVGQYVFGDPAQAGELLHQAVMIDPTSSFFEALRDYFDEIHQAVAALELFKPKSDGTNLAAWFVDVQKFLQPYLDDLPDRQLHAVVAALRRAAEGWTTVNNYLALGRRQPTIETARQTAEIIRPFNETIAAWLGALANRLPDATFVERHSPNTPLADALIEGWKAWDRGEGGRAAESGRQGRGYATTDGERLAADRLRRLGELLDGWLADDGLYDRDRTDQAETEALAILLAEEEQERRTFAEQMPNTMLYLRAMSRGIVSYMQQSSSAGWRALHLHYVLRGALALLTDELDEAEFWRNAAEKSFDGARAHPAFRSLDLALTRQRLVEAAEQALNAVSGPDDLETVRRAINAPLAGELLAGAEQSVQETQEALRDWSDGDFYAVRQSLDAALAHIQAAIEAADLHIDSFVAWLTDLRDAAADLQQARLTIEQGATSSSEEPDPAVATAHRRIVSVTLDKLGVNYVHQVRQWEDMYLAVLETYTTQRLTQPEKLAAFGRHFSSLFITKHPAYPLFRHWESIIEHLPVDQPEDELIPVEAGPVAHQLGEPLAYLEDDREPEPAFSARRRRPEESEGEFPWNRIILVSVVILLAAAGLAVVRYAGRDRNHPSQVGPVSTPLIGPAQPAGASPTPTLKPLATRPPTAAALPPSATETPVPVTPTVTRTPTVIPSETPTLSPPSLTPTLFLTSTFIPTETPAPVTLPGGSNGDVLAALARLSTDTLPWPAGSLTPGGDGSWLLSTGTAANSTLSLTLTPELLSQLFQPGTANTLINADVVLELVSYDAAALANGTVSFGLGAENKDGQQTIGQVQFVESDFVNLGMNQNGQFRSRTQMPQQNPQIKLSVSRVNPTTLGFYVDGKWLGDSVAVFAEGDPVTLVLFASGKDVVVKISSFTITFSPRDELP